MHSITKLLCPTWQKKLTDHAVIHALSHGPSEGDDPITGRVRIWVHSTESSISKMIESGNLGCRYTFVSAISCGLHRVAHSHFGLSAATLRAGTLLLGLEVSEDWLIHNGQLAVNGYSES
eukprot:3457818-Amphidinium_carterae.1